LAAVGATNGPGVVIRDGSYRVQSIARRAGIGTINHAPRRAAGRGRRWRRRVGERAGGGRSCGRRKAIALGETDGHIVNPPATTVYRLTCALTEAEAHALPAPGHQVHRALHPPARRANP